MSVLEISIVLLLRVGIILVLYAFLLALIVAAHRDLSAEARNGAATGSERLVVLDPGQSPLAPGQAFALWPVTLLGRDTENAVTLEDDYVSAVHASAFFRDGGWWVRDEGSTNGTLLNGQPVEGEAPLRAGDEIQVGRVRFGVVL